MKEINKLNAEFKKANKAQKRVMIAQDVLAQLKTKRYVAESGCWVQPNYYPDWKQLSDKDSVQELFAANSFGLFPDETRIDRQTLEAFEKATIGFVLPAHEA